MGRTARNHPKAFELPKGGKHFCPCKTDHRKDREGKSEKKKTGTEKENAVKSGSGGKVENPLEEKGKYLRGQKNLHTPN